MKFIILPILVAILTSYLVSKSHEIKKPSPTVKESLQVQPRPDPKPPEAINPEINQPDPIGDSLRTLDLDSVALLVKAENDKIFGADHWPSFWKLIMKESSWNPQAVNKSSGACGLFQALPCSKMGGMELANQIKWGVNYIKQRYGTPTAALAFHLQHGWY